ncbi:recombinase family protein [Halorubrum sp. SP9]|nr:recombinase family protein [Halorubrum sp. SP9]
MDQISDRDRLYGDDEQEDIRAAVYARTSSAKQSFGHSLNEQVRLSIERCQMLDWEVVFVFRDEAESGKDPDRPMFQSMLRAAEKQAFDVVVFWKLDRFSRSLMHAVQLESKLRQYDVGLYSITEQIDTTTASGRFNFRNIASAAEFERDMIQQRTKMGLHALAVEYKWPNDNPPLGYVVAESGRLRIVSEDADIVRTIFLRYTRGQSMPEVADWLNKSGLQTRSGGNWTPRAVGDVLRTELYRGRYELGTVSEQVPEYRIIDDELFEKVEKIRLRFRNGGGKIEKMPRSRKERTAQRMKRRYCDYLDSYG